MSRLRPGPTLVASGVLLFTRKHTTCSQMRRPSALISQALRLTIVLIEAQAAARWVYGLSARLFQLWHRRGSGRLTKGHA